MKDKFECTRSENGKCTQFTSSMTNLRDGLICGVDGECLAARQDHCSPYTSGVDMAKVVDNG